MNWSEKLELMRKELRFMATQLIAEDELEAAILAVGSAQAVQALEGQIGEAALEEIEWTMPDE